MTNYADYHFTTEENYMQAANYPDFENHQQEHYRFMRKAAELSVNTIHLHQSVPEELL
jgi:hemerythrin-like metal-binding protein